jgi:hypothetical protein
MFVTYKLHQIRRRKKKGLPPKTPVEEKEDPINNTIWTDNFSYANTVEEIQALDNDESRNRKSKGVKNIDQMARRLMYDEKERLAAVR